MFRKIFSHLIVYVVLFCLVAPTVSSGDGLLGNIDKNESYDIYAGNITDGDVIIIRRVKVLRIDKINDLEFLVFINDAGFNAKGKEGFILFSGIHVIVPSSSFTISGTERTKQF